MTTADLDARAHELYDACPTVKPAWHQLGDVTKSVWRDLVRDGGTPADYLPGPRVVNVQPPAPIPQPAAGTQFGLF